jgi:hypothetical protein
VKLIKTGKTLMALHLDADAWIAARESSCPMKDLGFLSSLSSRQPSQSSHHVAVKDSTVSPNFGVVVEQRGTWDDTKKKA